MDATSLYQDIILDHYREKHHSGLREPFDTEVSHVNPSCGDELTLRLARDDEVVADLSYDGVGCSISQASTSIMTDLVIGRSVDEALALHDEFQAVMQSAGRAEFDEERFGDAIALAGVAQFPGRVKCAMLAWSALRDAVIRSQDD